MLSVVLELSAALEDWKLSFSLVCCWTWSGPYVALLLLQPCIPWWSFFIPSSSSMCRMNWGWLSGPTCGNTIRVGLNESQYRCYISTRYLFFCFALFKSRVTLCMVSTQLFVKIFCINVKLRYNTNLHQISCTLWNIGELNVKCWHFTKPCYCLISKMQKYCYSLLPYSNMAEKVLPFPALFLFHGLLTYFFHILAERLYNTGKNWFSGSFLMVFWQLKGFDSPGHGRIVVIIFTRGVRTSVHPKNKIRITTNIMSEHNENLLAVTWWVILNSPDLFHSFFTVFPGFGNWFPP